MNRKHTKADVNPRTICKMGNVNESQTSGNRESSSKYRHAATRPGSGYLEDKTDLVQVQSHPLESMADATGRTQTLCRDHEVRGRHKGQAGTQLRLGGACLAHLQHRLPTPGLHNLSMADAPLFSALGKSRQEAQECKVIFRRMSSVRPAWET